MRRLFAVSALILVATAAPAAAGDAAEGARVFRKCKACHTAEEGAPDKVGPNLHGIVGAEGGRREGFGYSSAFKERATEGLVWTEDNLDAWLTDPQRFIKGARMVLRLREATDRADVIAYLKSLD